MEDGYDFEDDDDEGGGDPFLFRDETEGDMKIQSSIFATHPQMQNLRGRMNAGEKLYLCIRYPKQFLAKEAFAYFDDVDVPLRAFKPRKTLTEEYNGRVCKEGIAEEFVWFDYYVFPERRKKAKLTLYDRDKDVVTYDNFFETTGKVPSMAEYLTKRDKKEKGIKGKIPELGEEITLVLKNVHNADRESVRKFSGKVIDRSYGKARISWETFNISKDKSNKNFGVVLIHVDLTQYFLQRSIVFPPKIPKFVSLKMD